MRAARNVANARSMLFVPGNRPDRFDKAVAAGADVVVLDLEDAVPPDEKAAARDIIAEALPEAAPSVIVRVNSVGTPWHDDDIAMVRESGRDVMLPKAESADQIAALAIPPSSSARVVALVETPLGILDALAVASAPGVARLAFGTLDLAATLAVDPDDWGALASARSSLVLASAAAGLAGPVDGVTQAVRDTERLQDDLGRGRALGYAGKLCIHPAQLEVTHRAFTPTADELRWAQRVLDATADAAFAQGGVVALDGQMVDAPVVRRAENIVTAAGRVGSDATR